MARVIRLDQVGTYVEQQDGEAAAFRSAGN
jgi:hypothetical protein